MFDLLVLSGSSRLVRPPAERRGAGGPAEGRSGCRRLRVLRPAGRKSVQAAGGELEQTHEQRLVRVGQNGSVDAS